jgi:DNA modification methylase
VTKPGRNCCVHVQQLSTTLVTHGVIGMQDFRGDVIRAFVDGGWVYHGEVCIDKDPQAQAIRTHSKGLLFVQLRKDSIWSRPAFADYIVIFRKPGENTVPVNPDITNDEWIEWARPIWYGIKESDTLNVAVARGDKDDRHICPLQLGTIERCIRLWSNRGETVFDPFSGIGSTGVVAIEQGRHFIGCELKKEYFDVACRNLSKAERDIAQATLFDMTSL